MMNRQSKPSPSGAGIPHSSPGEIPLQISSYQALFSEYDPGKASLAPHLLTYLEGRAADVPDKLPVSLRIMGADMTPTQRDVFIHLVHLHYRETYQRRKREVTGLLCRSCLLTGLGVALLTSSLLFSQQAGIWLDTVGMLSAAVLLLVGLWDFLPQWVRRRQTLGPLSRLSRCRLTGHSQETTETIPPYKTTKKETEP